ncbi:MAG: hypothetical protein ACXVPN_15685 [Bacteroidia bacterium]
MAFLKNHTVNITIALVFFYSAWLAGNLGAYDQANIDDDVICYHAYAPALFIKKDIRLDFYKDSVKYYADRKMYWAVWQANGNPVIKTTCGQELMYLPFTAGVFMYYAGDNVTGYEAPFSAAISISTLVYYLLSLLLLKKILRHFRFSENAIALTIICISLGTNLLSYTTAYLGMPHVNDFFLLCCIMYLLIKWYGTQKTRYGILIGLCFGLLVLIRPTNILFGLLIPLYGVNNVDSLKLNFKFLLSNVKGLSVMALFALVAFSPQLVYWKYVTGNWFYFSYVGEQFFYNNPHLIEYVFGFRKGWLIYSPIVILAVIGLFRKSGMTNVFLAGTIMIIASSLYLNSSWWCWWFGGGFGARSMIEVYPLLAFGFCNFFEHLQFKKAKLWLAGIIFSLVIFHNIKSSYLNRINKIHYDSMTFAAYKYLFFKIDVSPEDDKILETLYVHPDYDLARKGINT